MSRHMYKCQRKVINGHNTQLPYLSKEATYIATVQIKGAVCESILWLNFTRICVSDRIIEDVFELLCLFGCNDGLQYGFVVIVN